MKDNSFEYNYSAKEQAEIKRIRERYEAKAEPEEDKMAQLRRLDESVTKKGSTASLIIGILGAIIMGTGMSTVMTELGAPLGVYAIPVGVAVGCIGIIMVALAYPVYMHITKKERERIAPEIIRLTDELLK
ncbi:MAG: hypothetical protein IJ519_04595 [Clostridia bacterium]|nr:hypothetical protein [Clostridia bacterium]